MFTVAARSMASAGAPFRPTTIERRDPGPHDVVIDIAYAGICHSDIHTARNEWGEALFPLVPGHEIAGVVSAVGAEVTRFALGDRAGVGCFVDSCRACATCRRGHEQYCENGAVFTYNSRDADGRPTDGGYSEKIVVDENYVLHIPEALSLEAAAPLLCAGITMYSPLRRFGAGSGRQVAVVGMGGLGHVGVKIAHAMGAEVTVLSHSLRKKDDGLRFGAQHYFPTSDAATFATLDRRFDLIVSTLSANAPVADFLRLLALDGVLVNVGLPDADFVVPPGILIERRVSLAGSSIGGIAETQEMLDFCAEHHIAAEIELIAADEIDAAYDRVVASDVRYRFVIDIATLGS